MGTAGRVPVFMPVSDGVNFLPGGFGRQVLDRLAKEKALPGPATDVEALKRVYDALVSESGAAFSFYTTLSAVESEGGRVRHVVCSAPGGLFAVRAKVYVDATGNGESYGIPYRVITPKGLDNVLVAGRCVSTDQLVQGSLRVMPGCFITGQAAGIAAAMASNSGKSVHGIDVKELQRRLKAFGAYLPNA